MRRAVSALSVVLAPMAPHAAASEDAVFRKAVVSVVSSRWPLIRRKRVAARPRARPTQRRIVPAIAPALDVARDVARRPDRVLDAVGGGEEALQPRRQLQGEHRQRFLEALPQTGRGVHVAVALPSPPEEEVVDTERYRDMTVRLSPSF